MHSADVCCVRDRELTIPTYIGWAAFDCFIFCWTGTLWWRGTYIGRRKYCTVEMNGGQTKKMHGVCVVRGDE